MGRGPRSTTRTAELLPPSHPPLRQFGMVVLVVPVPPVVRRGLRIALGRVFPLFLASERGHVEVAPGAPEGLVTTVVEEVGTEYLVAVADERIRAVVFVDAEVDVPIAGHRVPRLRPAHPCLQARDIWLRRARGVGEDRKSVV